MNTSPETTTQRSLALKLAAVLGIVLGIVLAVVLMASPAFAASGAQEIDCAADSNGFCTGNIQTFTKTLMNYALLTALGGILISATLWALGSKGQNPGTELTGKRGIILCVTAAFFVGALPSMIEYLEDRATELDSSGITSRSPVMPGTQGTVPTRPGPPVAPVAPPMDPGGPNGNPFVPPNSPKPPPFVPPGL